MEKPCNIFDLPQAASIKHGGRLASYLCHLLLLYQYWYGTGMQVCCIDDELRSCFDFANEKHALHTMCVQRDIRTDLCTRGLQENT